MLEQALVEAITTQRNTILPALKGFSNTFHMWKERALPTCPARPGLQYTQWCTPCCIHFPKKKSASYVCPIQLQANCLELKARSRSLQNVNVVSQLKPWKYKTTRHPNIIQRVLNILGTISTFSRATFDSRDPLVRNDLHT